MSIIDRYLNFHNNIEIFNNLGIEINTNILEYNKYYKEYINNPENIKNYIREQLSSYINKNYTLINIIDADINYYIEHINLFVKNKFSNVILKINIDHIISMTDYSTSSNKNYLFWRNEYYKMVYNDILCGKYKPVKYENKIKLEELINDNWTKINFNNLIEFTKTLNKINFFGQNVDNYIEIIAGKFDSNENIIKLLEYINKVFFEDFKNTKEVLGNEIDNIIENVDWVKESKKYNFRFVIDNLKSNGYLLFEEFNKQIKIKYKKSQQIESIKKDKKLINYFIYIVSQKNSNSVNRQVNEILLRIRDYICDLEDSHYNNIGYQKIIVKQESEKYQLIDLSQYNRTNATFNIFKYSHVNSQVNSHTNLNQVSKFVLDSKIEPYFDIYKSYYNSRYPDREIEFDLYQSTMIVKIKFIEKTYYIHMGLIQYIVLDKIYSNQEISLLKISEQAQIPIENLQETINSLLQIKIIKHSNSTSIENLILNINNDFVHDNNKISISSLIIKENDLTTNSNTNSNHKEFIHDRNTIVLSNLYDYIKKNKTFTKDVLITELGYKIPFKINEEQINSCILTLLEKEHIIKINLMNPYNNNSEDLQQIYQLVE